MKYNFNKMTQEEKQTILEMHQGVQKKLNEQKIFSNIKSDVRGLGQRLKTGAQNIKGSFSKTKGVAVRPSAGLQQDLTKVQSRSGDLMKTIQPLVAEITTIIQKLQANQNAYGTGYENQQNDFMTQLNNLKTTLDNTTNFLNAMRGYQPNYQQQTPGGQPLQQSTETQGETSKVEQGGVEQSGEQQVTDIGDVDSYTES